MDRKKEFLINTLFYILIAIIAFFAFKYLIPVFLPFIIAFIIAVLLQRPIRKISEKIHLKKKITAVIAVAVFYGIIFLVVFFAGSRMISGCMQFVLNLPDYYNNTIYPWINKSMEYISEDSKGGIARTVMPYIKNYMENITANLEHAFSEYSGKTISFMSGLIAAVPGIIIKIVITIAATFFITIDYDNIREYLKKVLPGKFAGAIDSISTQINSVMGIYLKSYSFLMGLTFVELSAGFWLLKIPHPFLIALGITVFDILPVLGTGGILIPWAIGAFFIKNYTMGTGIIILYLFITIIRNILEPKIVGKQMGLHPLITLIALTAGMKFFGIVGLIGLPMLVSVGWNMYNKRK